MAHSHFDYKWSPLNFRIPSHDCITLNACSHGPAVNKYLYMEPKEKNLMYSFILVQICGINCAASANVLVVIFLVTPGKCKLQKHGYGYKALRQIFAFGHFALVQLCVSQAIILLGKIAGNLKQKHKCSRHIKLKRMEK